MRSAGITAQLLAFGRRQILRPEVVDLNATVAGFEPVLRRTMGDQYTIALDLGPGMVQGPGRPGAARAGAAEPRAQCRGCDARWRASHAPDRGDHPGVPGDRRLPLEPDVKPGPYVELVMRIRARAWTRPPSTGSSSRSSRPSRWERGPASGSRRSTASCARAAATSRRRARPGRDRRSRSTFRSPPRRRRGAQRSRTDRRQRDAGRS